MRTEEFIKALIMEKYGTINKFAKIVNIPQSTLATALSKEGGFDRMSVGKAMKICHMLGINVDTLDDIESDKPLSIFEAKLLMNFNQLSRPYQDVVLNVLDDLLKLEKNQTTLIMPMLEETLKPTTTLDYYPQAAGMGTGQYVKDAIPEKISVPTDKIPPKTDFIIRVVGDSMEPTFYSGDKLFIQSTDYLDIGDIGVFNIDGEQMVKEAGNGELISHNKQYPPIKTKNCHLVVQGKVLGKL